MKTGPGLKIGVLFNPFVERRQGADKEAGSELAVESAAEQAAQALRAAGLRVALLPAAGSVADLVRRILRARVDAVVNLCEGFRGDPKFEAQAAGLLELMGLPATGCGSRTLAICQNKYQTKALLAARGIRTPRGWPAETCRDLPSAPPFPLMVKPNAEDGSRGIYPESVVRTRSALRRQIARVVERYGAPALVEEFLDGREFNVAVVQAPETRALPVSEIAFTDFPEGRPRIVDFPAKWDASHPSYRRTVPVCPARISKAMAGNLSALALRAFRELGLRGYGRVDFRTDARGRPAIIEVNPNPDTNRGAGFMLALEAAGIPASDFWLGQVQLALSLKHAWKMPKCPQPRQARKGRTA